MIVGQSHRFTASKWQKNSCSVWQPLCLRGLAIRDEYRRKVYDEYNDEEVELTKEEVDMIRRIRQGKIPHADVNPYEVCEFNGLASILFLWCES